MQEIEIKLVVNASAAIKSIREVAAESQKLHSNYEKNQKRQVGLIADIEQELGKLQEAQKQALTVQNIEKFNKKIAEAKKDLDAYNKAGIEGNKQVEKSSDGVIGKIGKMALAYLTVTTAIKLAKETVLAFFTKTEKGVELVERKVAGLKAAWSVLAGEFVSGGKKMADSLDKSEKKSKEFWTTITSILGPAFLSLGVRMDMAAQAAENYTRSLQEIEDAERAMIVPRAKANAEIAKARLLYADTTKSAVVRVAALERALELEQETADKEIKLQQWTILNLRDINNEKEKTGQLRDEDRLAMEQAIAREIELQTESNQRQVRATNSLMAARKEFFEKDLQSQEKFYALALKLIEDYDKSMIESLSGADKLKAQKDFGLKQIELFRKQMEEMGTLTPEQEKMFEFLAEQVNDAYVQGMQKSKLKVKVKPLSRETIEETVKEGQKLRHTSIQTEPMDHSLWSIMGIDPDTDKGKEMIDSIKEMAGQLTGVIDDIYDARVEDAQRTRELAQSRLDEAQQELETEIELYKAGYASNVEAKKKELGQLKKERDLALKDEQKALAAQRKFDTLMQASSLITASANIYKSLSKLGPVGVAIAALTIAGMLTAFAVTKNRVNKATKLARGAHGEVTGRLHSQGGESFLDHVEVEQGERWGVLSRSASRKYGNSFGKMVDSFNKESLPVPRQGININNISVQNDGPNERLDVLIKQQKSKEEVIVMGNKVIYKKGNNQRIIRK